MAFVKTVHKFTTDITFFNENTGESKKIDKCLSSIAIKKDFYNNVFPLYVLVLKLSESDRKYIVENDIYLNLTIYKYTVSENLESSTDTTASDPVTDGVVLNLLLKPLDKSLLYEINIENDVDNNNDNETLEEQRVSYQLNCVPKEKIAYNDIIINECYEKANLNEIILNIVSSIYKKEIYLQESLNTNRYDSLLIPPMNLIPALNFLHDTYSIYNNDLNIFFDTNKLYVYDIQEASRYFKNNLMINILRQTDTTDKTKFQQAEIDENDNINIYLREMPIVMSNHDVFKNDTGYTTTFSSYDENFNIINRTYTDSNNTGKSRYFWNPMINKVFEEKQLKKIYQTVSTNIYNVDPNLILPDTRIFISGAPIDETNGDYAILTEEIYYSTSDYTNFTNTIILTLGKI